jgi:uncharacterized protein
MFEYFTQATWSPYVAGAGIGILVCLSFLLADRPLGCSSAFIKARGMIEKSVSAENVQKKEYYREVIPKVDWSFMIIPGVIIGAFFSAMLSGQFHLYWVPSMWGNFFGYNTAVRLFWALIGGVLLGFGARWAGGCTSGHGISGSSQLSLASMVTAACFFAGGIATALVIFRVIGG